MENPTKSSNFWLHRPALKLFCQHLEEEIQWEEQFDNCDDQDHGVGEDCDYDEEVDDHNDGDVGEEDGDLHEAGELQLVALLTLDQLHLSCVHRPRHLSHLRTNIEIFYKYK